MQLKTILSFLCLFSLTQAYSQIIIDEQTEDPIPFAIIVPEDTSQTTTIADEDGQFKLNEGTDFLVSAIGYQPATFTYSKGERFALIPESYTIDQVVVTTSSRDPAVELIQKVISNKKRNSIDGLDQYSCKVYNKFKAGFLGGPLLESTDIPFPGNDIFISESHVNRRHRRPSKTQQTILATNVSGLKTSQFAVLEAQEQPFDLYKNNTLIFFDQEFVSPIASQSWLRYDFQIMDTIPSSDQEIYIVNFAPRRLSGTGLLSGTMHISSIDYAFKNFRAQNNDGTWKFEIEQSFDRYQEKWFPTIIRSKMLSAEGVEPQLKITNETKVDHTTLSFEPFNKFNANLISFDAEALKRDEEYWSVARPDTLTKTEVRTYEVIDSLSEAKQVEKRLKKLSPLFTGKLGLAAFDLDVRQLLVTNEYENYRTAIDLETNNKLSKRFSIGGYTAYGFDDDEFKYGGRAAVCLGKHKLHKIIANYNHDIEEVATNTDSYSEGGVVGRTTRQYNLAERFNDIKKGSVGVESKLGNWVLSLTGTAKSIQPLYDYSYLGANTFNDANLGVSATWQKRQTIQILDRYIDYKDEFSPILKVNLEQGIPNVFNNGISYTRFSLSGQKKVRHQVFGEVEFIAKVGMVSENVPLYLLFDSNGNNTGELNFFSSGTFQTMNLYSFYSDQYVNLFLRDNLGRLFNSKYSAPELILHQAFGIGGLNNSDSYVGVSVQPYDKGYWESGIHFENLLKTEVAGLFTIGGGVGAYTNYGAYAQEDFMDNTALKLSVDIGF